MAGSVATVGGLTLASRVLGFARDVLIAAALGGGPLADAFFVALRLPNLFRALFAEGAFAAAFVPVFSARLERAGPEAARAFAASAASILLLVSIPAVLLAEWGMPWVVGLLAPGFEADGERFAGAVDLARITFPYLALVTMTALFGAVLNSLYRFAAAAAAPALLNLFLIGFLVVAAPLLPSAAEALAWGVLAGGAAQLALVALAARRAGMAVVPGRPRLTPDVRRFGRLMAPGVLSSGVSQVNVVVGTVFASGIPGAVSWLSYAHHLVHLPVAVVGIAVRTVLLPALSRRVHGGDGAGGTADQRAALGLALALAAPAAVGLAALSGLIVDVLFRRGAFGLGDSAATADALAAYALGLPAMVLVQALVSSFFARYDTATPMKVAAGAVALNLALIPLLIGPFGHVGIALAQSASSTAHAAGLLVLAVRRGYLALDGAVLGRALGVAAAALPLGLLGLAEGPALALLAPLGPAAGAGALVLLVGAGTAGFGALALAFGALRPGEAARLLGRRGRRAG